MGYSCIAFQCIVVLLFFLNKCCALERTSLSLKSCWNDSGCYDQSFCYGNSHDKTGHCKCNEEHYIFCDRKAYNCSRPIQGVGSSCLCDEHCEFTLGISSECGIRNTCECLPDSHYIKSKNSCYKTSKLGDTCVDDDNCLSDFGEKNYCTNGRCTCGLNLRPTEEGRCVQSIPLGEACDKDESCIHLNAVCRATCTCKVGYVVKDNEENCLKAATSLGEKCEQLSQCDRYIYNSECLNGTCACQSGYHGYGNMCFENKKVYDICQDRRECVRYSGLENLIDCQQNVCVCKYGMDHNNECAEINGANYRYLQITALISSAILFLYIY